ncbi:hypothetical protein [Pedobacter sp. V48]|uniref:hypothetical protein n=1 Tax=Pedobacter sp. V48 TaxID=509635 RepID=UPI0003E53C99|nr:hypothetical protein [Pedobacter sp. V48]ETZ19212.1 hypothetical protein N824_10750 [Pedobacter sp. V48]
MKQTFLIVAYSLIVLLALSTAAISVVQLPSFIKEFDLTTAHAANIGTALSGITTPFFTAISSVLIFFALIKQIESNKDQRSKSDGDMVFMLLNQLDLDVENFSYQAARQGGEPQISTGYYALLNMARGLRFDLNNTEAQFFKTIHGSKIILMAKSFEMIEKRIEKSNFTADDKDFFRFKLYSFYHTKLRNSLRYLIENNNFQDKTSIEPVAYILSFYNAANTKASQYIGEIN